MELGVGLRDASLIKVDDDDDDDDQYCHKDNDDDDETCHNDNDEYHDDNCKRWNLGSVYEMLLSSKLMMAITVLVTLAFFGVTMMMTVIFFIPLGDGFDNHDGVIWLL